MTFRPALIDELLHGYKDASEWVKVASLSN